MSEKQKEEAEQIMDDAAEEHHEDHEEPGEEQAVVEGKKRRRFSGFWKFIILVALLTAVVIVYLPKNTREHYLDLTTKFIASQWMKKTATDTEKTVATPAPTTAAEVQKTSVAETEPAPVVSDAVTADSVDTSSTIAPVIVGGASSEEIERMLQAMEGLRGEILSLQQQQQSLQKRQAEMQRMQLRTRLHWITNQANHLPQLQLAWEEIALMPSLSSDERSSAEAMQALAGKRGEDLMRWRQALQRYAETLTVKEQENVIPAFENGWLNWIAGQFSVRPSLNRQERQDAELRRQLINTSRNLELEHWPDEKQWLALRSKLQLRIVARTESSVDDTQPVQLGLPESFDVVKKDIEMLRSGASLWLESMQ